MSLKRYVLILTFYFNTVIMDMVKYCNIISTLVTFVTFQLSYGFVVSNESGKAIQKTNLWFLKILLTG